MYFVDLIKKYIFLYRVTSSIELNDWKNKSGDENKSQALKINYVSKAEHISRRRSTGSKEVWCWMKHYLHWDPKKWLYCFKQTNYYKLISYNILYITSIDSLLSLQYNISIVLLSYYNIILCWILLRYYLGDNKIMGNTVGKPIPEYTISHLIYVINE